MGTRKFTNSEIKAYTRNRHEEKTLRTRLQKLSKEFGDLYDTSVRHRSDLIEECRQMRKTSGGNPPGDEINDSSDFEFATRVSRPWAYSVMEITYNVLYQEANIPIPKRIVNKESPRNRKTLSCGNLETVIRPRVLSSRSLGTQRKSLNSARLVSEKTSPSLIQSSKFNINANLSKYSEDYTSKRHVTMNDLPDIIVSREIYKSDNTPLPIGTTTTMQINASNHIPQEAGVDSITQECNEADIFRSDKAISSSDSETKDLRIEQESIESYTTDETRNYNTKYISLPAVHKIYSNEHQKNVRQQMLERSKSRSEFKQTIIHSTDLDGISKNQSDHAVKTIPDAQQKESEIPQSATVVESTPAHTDDKKDEENNPKPRDIDILKSIDSSVTETLCVKAEDEVKYRGRTIHNYIRPEERYKLDPIVLKRRQNRMDKLAKESATFLKRVNHENIRVEIAFPRSSRKRLLTRLVDENNCDKGRKTRNDNEEFLRHKIDDFMVSVSNYIRSQKAD